ncbi:formyltransferase family protein [Litorilituus sediminis]|uniref:Methionyl-tRNA formyltransferase n=1 Tax=Litorilituus sediminis TaxID=718192 RepID=A0A4V0ZFW5_9GAMM|nr:formyltransferase family protein [Litorilituus sediminis]QBG35220.1 hypothetical protein EMK97_05565 [Litorilituus sediminis]
MSQATSNFAQLKHIVLIGGGDLMLASAQIFRQLNYQVSIIAALRHLDEPLVLSATTLAKFCQQNSIALHSTADINQLTAQELNHIIPAQAMAICFGPAWVFQKHIIEQFNFGMFNINAIPIPHYLGGAHYTWQLLNNNKEGGCFFQQITTELDQGDILAQHNFTISDNAVTPDDYFQENVAQGKVFIASLAQKFKQGEPLQHTPYQTLNSHRLYLPRLRTDKQGFINWQWQAKDIVSFIQGFSAPYIGAATFIDGQKVRLKAVKLITLYSKTGQLIAPMHPFAQGLIIRKTATSIVVAATDGFIELISIENEQGNCVKNQLKEGMRLHTPQAELEQALSYQVVIDGTGFKD